MGFYVANEHQAVTEPRLRRQARKGTPLKKSRLEFFSSTRSRTGFFASQTLDTHRKKRSTPTNIASGVRYYGYRYYSPSLARWLSRDPIGEEWFELTSYYPLSQEDKIVRDLRSILNAVQFSMPEIVQSIKRLLFDIGIDLLSLQSQKNLYSFVGNHSIGKFDPFGLQTNDQCCDKESKEAAKKLIDELISNLLDQAKNLPGKAGEIAKLINMLKKIKDTGESCAAMKDVADTCADFARDPHVESCYACCMQMYGSFGSLYGGIGHNVCTVICVKFTGMP